MGPWQHCSVTCGDKGTHHRTVICIRSLGSDEQIALEDQACESLEKPVEMEPCHHKNPCPGLGVWEVEEWSNVRVYFVFFKETSPQFYVTEKMLLNFFFKVSHYYRSRDYNK